MPDFFRDDSGLDATADFGSTNNAARDAKRLGTPGGGIFERLFGGRKPDKITSQPLPDITPQQPQPSITSAPSLVSRVIQASAPPPPPPPAPNPLGPGQAPPPPGVPPQGQGLAPGFPFSPQQLLDPAGPFGVMSGTGVPASPPPGPGLAPGFPFTPEQMMDPNGPFAVRDLPPSRGRDVFDPVGSVGGVPRFEGPEPPRRAAPGPVARAAGIFSNDPNSTVSSRFQDAMNHPTIWDYLAARFGSAAGNTRPMPSERPRPSGPQSRMPSPADRLRGLGSREAPPYIGPHTPMPDATYGAMPGFFAGGGVHGYARGGLPQLQMGMPQRRPFATGGGQRYVPADGRGDGRSDHVPAVLSPGEFVQDAETVALLGNGDNEAGARGMEAIRKEIRKHKGKALAKGKFSPKAQSPERLARVGMKAASKKKGK